MSLIIWKVLAMCRDTFQWDVDQNESTSLCEDGKHKDIVGFAAYAGCRFFEANAMNLVIS